MKRLYLPALTVLTVALIVAAILVQPIVTTQAADGDSNFTNLVASGDITVGDDLSVTDDLYVGDDLTVTGDFTLPAPAAVAITQDYTITPASAFVLLTAAGTVSTSSITAGNEGDVLILVNSANQTITFTDTGTLKLSGNISLGQYDSLTLISDGTNWVQLATSNN